MGRYIDDLFKTGDVTTPFRISIYNKRDDFAFWIVNFPHMDSNIPANPAYGVYLSQLVRYARICTSKVDFHYVSDYTDFHYVSDNKALKPIDFRTHLINSSIAMVLSSRSMVQSCGR